MAEKLPDELIKEILSPVLHVPDELFADASGGSVFFRFDLSTSALLLVCKRWLRVATPLLYEVVILRSKPQAQALAQVFASNKQLGTFVQKLRVEGGFGAPMEKIIKASPNITHLYLSMAIYSNDSVSGLSRSLASISPLQLVLYDCSFPQLDNTNTRQLTKALCDAISSSWKLLAVVHNPYTHDDTKTIQRQNAIVNALIKCPTLRLVHYSSCPVHDSKTLKHLSEASQIHTIRIRADRKGSARYLKGKLDPASRLAKIVDFVRTPAPLPAVVDNPIVPSGTDYVPMSSTPMDISAKIWTQILSFAMGNDWCDRDFDFADHLLYRRSKYSSTRKSILTVSKEFHEIGLPLAYSYPVLALPTQLRLLSDQLVKNPASGAHIRSVFLNLRVSPVQRPIIAAIEENLAQVVACSRSLIRIHQSHDRNCSLWLPMRWTTFKALAESSGPSLLSFAGFEVSNRERGNKMEFCVFNRFQKLHSLQWTSTIQLEESMEPISGTCLSSLETLKIRDCNKSFFEHLLRLSLPSLSHVEIGISDNPTAIEFLERHGSKLKTLVTTSNDQIVPLFELCPNITHLKLGWIFEAPAPSLFRSELPHTCLTHITICACQQYGRVKNLGKYHRSQWSSFFQDIDLTPFPALLEIKLMACEWPTNERSIANDPWVLFAENLREKWNVTLTDGEGKAWRSRLKGPR